MHVMFTHILHSGKDEKLRLRFDSSIARERCRRQRPEGRGAQRRVILPPCLFRYPSFIFTSSATALLPDGASLIRPTKPAPSVESCNMPLPDGASLIGPTKSAPNVESYNMPLPMALCLSGLQNQRPVLNRAKCPVLHCANP